MERDDIATGNAGWESLDKLSWLSRRETSDDENSAIFFNYMYEKSNYPVYVCTFGYKI